MNVRTILFLAIVAISNLAFAQAKLVSKDWLAENAKDTSIVLVDMSDSLQYQRFHLPGAINLPYDYLVQDRKKVSLSVDQQKLIKLLGQIGISRNSYVIAYDDTGGLHASRLLWELEQLHHPKMALLDGGLVKWIREGRSVSAHPPVIKPTVYKADKSDRAATAGLQDVAPDSRNKSTLLLDVRTDEEYMGNPRYPRSGHIPGAKWWQWDQALDIDNGFSIRQSDDLLKELTGVGLSDKKQPVVVYCRSGHRAAHTYFTLKHLGFENVRLYDGSMKEYEQHKALPLTKGKNP